MKSNLTIITLLLSLSIGCKKNLEVKKEPFVPADTIQHPTDPIPPLITTEEKEPELLPEDNQPQETIEIYFQNLLQNRIKEIEKEFLNQLENACTANHRSKENKQSVPQIMETILTCTTFQELLQNNIKEIEKEILNDLENIRTKNYPLNMNAQAFAQTMEEISTHGKKSNNFRITKEQKIKINEITTNISKAVMKAYIEKNPTELKEKIFSIKTLENYGKFIWNFITTKVISSIIEKAINKGITKALGISEK